MKLLAAAGAIGLIAALILPALQTSPPYRPIEVIESLKDPVVVLDHDEHGLLLANGQMVGLPGVLRLPAASLAIERATGSGVEVTPEGRVVGLLHVRPFCGQDPVRIRIMRIDLAHLLMYLGEVEFDQEKLLALGERERRRPYHFWERGWRISEFMDFDSWSKAAGAHGL